MVVFDDFDNAGFEYYNLVCDACERKYKFGVYKPAVEESFILYPTPDHNVISGIGYNEIYNRILYKNGEIYDICYNCLRHIGNIPENITYPFSKFIENLSKDLSEKTIHDIRTQIISCRREIKETKSKIKRLNNIIKTMDESDILNKFPDLERSFLRLNKQQNIREIHDDA